MEGDGRVCAQPSLIIQFSHRLAPATATVPDPLVLPAVHHTPHRSNWELTSMD